MGIGLGLSVALSYGVADFLARYSTQRLGVQRALLIALLTGTTLLSLWLWWRGTTFQELEPALGWLMLSGALSYAMLAFLYAALARGPIGVASPVVATHPALVVLLLVLQGSRPQPLEWCGLAITLLGGLGLATQIDPVGEAQGLGRSGARRTALLAALCAVTLSFQILSVQHAARASDAITAAWGTRIFALLPAALVWGFGLIRRTDAPPATDRNGYLLSLLQGVLEITAVVSLALGSAEPSRTIVPVIGSAFSAVTVLLARVVLKEVMTGRQWISILVLMAGIVTLGAA